jgi:hypothetical protein
VLVLVRGNVRGLVADRAGQVETMSPWPTRPLRRAPPQFRWCTT